MTVEPLKVMRQRVCVLEGALIGLADRIDGLLDRPVEWSREYLRVVLEEIARTARDIAEEGQ